MTHRPIERYLDHAVLKPQFSRDEAEREMRVGLEYNVRTICARPCDLEPAVSMCRGTETDPCAVLAFPHGVQLSSSKAAEARAYVELGAVEIDMVANYGHIRSAMWAEVLADIRGVVEVAHGGGAKVKVILETASLDRPAIVRATELAIEAGADWVKTSTGFGEGGAGQDAVRAMIEAAAGRIEVKASGGIRDLQRAELFLAMGCTRLGVGSTTTPVLCGGQSATGEESY